MASRPSAFFQTDATPATFLEDEGLNPRSFSHLLHPSPVLIFMGLFLQREATQFAQPTPEVRANERLIAERAARLENEPNVLL